MTLQVVLGSVAGFFLACALALLAWGVECWAERIARRRELEAFMARERARGL